MGKMVQEHARQQMEEKAEKAHAQEQLKQDMADHRAAMLEERQARLARQAQQHDMYSQQVGDRDAKLTCKGMHCCWVQLSETT